MPNQFAIFRTKKLTTHAEIARVGNHNDRRGKLPLNVDAARVEQNRSFTSDDKTPLLERVLEKLKDLKFRKDAVRAVEIVCGFSPGCEEHVPLDAWAQDSLAFIKERFGEENLVSAVLHFDEKTPHLQCVIVPIVGGRLAAKRLLGSRKKLRELQTGYHKAVAKYGLIRGTKGSDRPHLSMAEIYQGTQAGIEIVKSTIASLPKKSLLQGWESYRENLKAHLESALKPLTNAKTAAELASLEVESLRRIVDESEPARKAVADRLRSLDLREVATRLLGYEGIKAGQSTVFEDDGRKIAIVGNSFKDEKSKARGDRGAISLTRHILNVDFDTAVQTLAQHFPAENDVVEAEAFREAEAAIKSTVEMAARTPIDIAGKIERFATPDPTKLPTVVDYLEKTRGIPKAVIDSLTTTGKLLANRWGSAVFRKEDHRGATAGVTVIGTSSRFRQSIGTDDAFFHCGSLAKGKSVAIVESPIAALSYHAKTGGAVISTDRSANPLKLVEFLQALPAPEIIIAYRGDSRGERLAADLSAEAKKAGMATARLKPPKDQSWNDALRNPSPEAPASKRPKGQRLPKGQEK